MKTQNSASCRRNFSQGKTISTLLALCAFTFITLSTHLCDGQSGNAAMFEIPSVDKKFYMLKDCRKMAFGDVDCRCIYIGKECLRASRENCTKCSCLDDSIKIFYVKKRYGAVCLSANNLVNAAGFGENFLIHSPKYKVCARANKTTIQHTNDCTFNNLRQVWLWTPGNLLMNANTSTCLRTKQTEKNEYLPMFLASCNSSDDWQKWKCNDKLWWGVSFPGNSGSITHATRYYYKEFALKARAITEKVDDGNIWSVFPTHNLAVCSTRHKEGSFYLTGGKLNEKSQIDMAPQCPRDGCSQKLVASTNINHLSNCTIIWDEELSRDRRPFFIENQDNGLNLKWESDPRGSLSGKIFDLTIECLRNYTKFEEYHFRLGIKEIVFEKVAENNLTIETDSQEQSEIPIVDLQKNCLESLCTREVEGPSTLDKNKAVCFIEWKKSTILRLVNTSNVIVNVTELLFLRKDGKERFYLKWNLTHAAQLANILFNLSVLCYNDENKNTTIVEAFFLIFQTRYGFVPKSNSSEKSADNTALYLAIVLPVTVVLLLVAVLTIVYIFRRKQRRIKESQSKHNLHSNVEVQYSNDSVDTAAYLNSTGIECKSEDNPVYEQCIETTPHPAVTIARNQVYEYTHNIPAQQVSDVCELPIENAKVRKNEFYVSGSIIKHSPKPKSHVPSKPSSSTTQKPIQNASPKSTPKPGPKPQVLKKPLAPQYKVPKGTSSPEEDVYDQPLGFIPSLKRNNEDEVSKEEIALENLEEQRIHSIYEKPLPDSPPNSGIYEYATREELPINATGCKAEKPLEFTTGKDHGGSLTSNGSLYDTPHYDVLEQT